MKAIRSTIISPIASRLKTLKNYLFFIIIFLTASYSVYFIFDREFVSRLVVEDGLFEYLTAIFFLTASIVFFLSFLPNRNKCFLLLSAAMFVGAGEEISWGQRILGFSTPTNLAAVNVQKEFNFHNIELVNAAYLDHRKKEGIQKIFTVNFLYKLFWLTYGAILPATLLFFKPAERLFRKIKLPIPPLTLGIFFLINWLSYRFILVFFLEDNTAYEIDEVCECASAFLFAILSIYFLNNPAPIRTPGPDRRDSAPAGVR